MPTASGNSSYDALIIGAGHNGLVCAAYLARAGRRVLVVDDTFSTGARAQSAAATLRRAGYEPAGVAVVGRTVEPDASAWARRFWESLPSVA